MNNQNIIKKIRMHFNVIPDKESESETITQISSGVSFKGANLWILIFAIFIASLGLNVNSTAVIIGAMLISPLMGPITGMGLAVGINDFELLKRSAKNFGIATLISVLTATVYFFITPLGDAQSELLARTAPTLYDVMIALCGGAAGITALCTKGKGNVIPGVAIATALMPPLCTAGYGLATGHLLYFLGAFYLFFINTVFIALSTYAGVRLMRFKQKEFQNVTMAKKARRMIMAIVVITIIPAAFMTTEIVKQSISDKNLSHFIKSELTQTGTQIITSSVSKEDSTLNIVAVGKEIEPKKEKEAQARMELYGLAGYRLNIIQGEQSDSLLQLNDRLTQIKSNRESEQQKIIEISSQVNTLTSELAEYTKYETMAAEIKGEMKALFPQIKTLSLAKTAEVSRDTTAIRRYVIATIGTYKSHKLPHDDSELLRNWLKTRIKADSLVVVQMNE